MDGVRDGDFEAFGRIVRSRRSVRAFTDEPVPDAVIDACLDLALLAPNSQNLEPWQFLHVRDASALDELRALCLDQAPARAAPTMIVAVARPDFWRLTRRLNLAHYAGREGGEALAHKYRSTVPLIFEDGPAHLLAPFKSAVVALCGMWSVTWRGPFGRWGQALWATKTTALACENLMLALRAAGYDSCPMEGFDEPRIKRRFALPDDARVVMVLAIGRRDPRGVSERLRFDRDLFVRRV